MTPENFCYWLQGFFEIKGANEDSFKPITAKQAEMIENHLKLVFKNETQLLIRPADWQKNVEKLLDTKVNRHDDFKISCSPKGTGDMEKKDC